MFVDILFIFTTAFALFGLYCFVETISDMGMWAKFPHTVTIIKDCQDDMTFKKIKYIQENLPNNSITVYPFENSGNSQQSIEEFINDVLCVNNK